MGKRGLIVFRLQRSARALALVVLAFGIAATATSASAAQITVNNNLDITADDGLCTIREAIVAANTDTASGATGGECVAGAGADEIRFIFPGGGPHVMTPATELPAITQQVTISAFSELHEVVLDGAVASLPPSSQIGFRIEAANSTVSNLSIIHWNYGVAITDADNSTIQFSLIGTDESFTNKGNSDTGVEISTSDGVTINGNVIASSGQQGIRATTGDTANLTITSNNIGTNFAGTAALPNVGGGISLRDTVDATIGGGGFSSNLISGNGSAGITLSSSATHPNAGTTITNNRIGTSASGMSAIPNIVGINIVGDARGTTVEGNLVSGNTQSGIIIGDMVGPANTPSGTVVRANRIGVNSDVSGFLPNGSYGVEFDNAGNPFGPGNLIGGITGLTQNACTGDCNVIGGNGSNGVSVNGTSDHAAVLGNSINANSKLGIDLRDPLLASGIVTLNDAGDSDTGPNGFQNFPVIEAVYTQGGNTKITGRLDSAPNQDYRLEFFKNASGDPTGYGEGTSFLGALIVTTPASGIARFGGELVGEAPGGTISATATRIDTVNDRSVTSEFALNDLEGCDVEDTGATNVLTASGTGSTLCGLAGDDLFRLDNGGDILDGDVGTDTADLSDSASAVVADFPGRKIVAAHGVDLLISVENFIGTDFDDQVTGTNAANRIESGAGQDVIDARDGADTVRSGGATDTIDVLDGVADTEVNCGNGVDVVTADPTTVDPPAIFTGCETINRPGEPPATCETDASLCPPPPTCETDASLCPPPTCQTDASLCPEPPPVKKCDGVKATIVGTNKSETINGTTKRDVIVSLGGNDKVKAKAGNDLVCAGDGNDTVSAGDGNDRVLGQAGKDVLKGDGNKDKLNGGDGSDRLFGYGGKDVLKGADGGDRLDGGGGGKDSLKGGSGADRLKGAGGGKDRCDGGTGRDTKKSPGCEKRKRIP